MTKPLIIDLINEYMLNNRQVGHTRAAIFGVASHGLSESENLYLVHDYMFASMLKKRFPGVLCATIGDLRRGALKNQHRPMVVDNCVWFMAAEEVGHALHDAYQLGYKNGLNKKD